MDDLPLALFPPDPTVRIRPVRISDTSDLQESFWPERSYSAVYLLVLRTHRNARQRRGLGIVALDADDRFIGYAQLTLWPRCAELSDLIVNADHRGRGIGTALIQYLVKTARDMHAPCLEIGAALSNPGALALYRRLGFQDSHEVALNLGHGLEPVMFLRLEFSDTTT